KAAAPSRSGNLVMPPRGGRVLAGRRSVTEGAIGDDVDHARIRGRGAGGEARGPARAVESTRAADEYVGPCRHPCRRIKADTIEGDDDLVAVGSGVGWDTVGLLQ